MEADVGEYSPSTQNTENVPVRSIYSVNKQHRLKIVLCRNALAGYLCIPEPLLSTPPPGLCL